ncbi:MAG: 3-isopropylmalate dehydrogenase [Phycisphaeraceae bacterium]|nr:3-isopropylmalate dehydrogenase [Phycisphaeraceae bacterium]
MSLKIAILPGDGTGPEVVREALKVLSAVAKLERIDYTTEPFDYGGDRYLATGKIVDEDEIEQLRSDYDAILLGAIGHPDVAPGILEKGLLLRLRFALDQYINLRPVKLYPGVDCPLKDKGPQDIDFDVIRENTEDLYCGAGGFLRKGTPQEVATQEMIATRFGVERCLRYAFEYCRRRKASGAGKGCLTLVHKTNVLTFAADLWFRAFEEIGDADYTDIERDYNHIDAACMWFVKNPEFYDTVVVPNMFGDIITDLGAMIQGGMGIAAGGNINPDEGGTSMYEPIGGSAPKYTNQDVINPLAAIGALAMLLANSGEPKAGERVEKAIAATTPKLESLAAGRMGHSTTQVGDLVVAAL